MSDTPQQAHLKVLALVAARAGSVGVPGKNVRPLAGRPVIAYTLDAALAARRVDRIVVTTDDPKVKAICTWPQYRGRLTLVDRPAALADHAARIDDAMRHCCRVLQQTDGYRPDAVVLLYANVPVRAQGVIDRAIEQLQTGGGDSLQTVAPVGKFHPYWLHRLDGDRATKYLGNQVYRRQDLPPLYYIDGAVGVVRYDVLLAGAGGADPHAFWGRDRRALVQEPHQTIDIDTVRDFYLAEAALREKQDG